MKAISWKQRRRKERREHIALLKSAYAALQKAIPILRERQQRIASDTLDALAGKVMRLQTEKP